MSAETIVRSALSTVPKAVASGVVHLDSGLLLAIKTVESHPQRVIEILAPATREMFEGEMVSSIEEMFKKARGVENKDHYFQEMLVSSTHLWHYFGRLKTNQRVVVTVVTPADVNLGLFLMKCRDIVNTETV